MEITDNFVDENLFLFDTFEECIILEKDKDKSAPPERYFEIGTYPKNDIYIMESLDVYTDTYWVNREKGLLIDFAYTYFESWNVNPDWSKLLYAHFERHGLPRKEYELKRRIYPRARFKKLLELYFNKEE